MLTRLVIPILLIGLLQAADDGCSRLAEARENTYGFAPSSLPNVEKTARLQALDRFWNLAKSDPKLSAGCLRSMLEKPKQDSFFLFDASRLLFTLDKSRESADVVAAALAGVDLNDIRTYDYVELALEASKTGADITGAAVNFARAGKVDDYHPGFGTRMTRETGMVVLFGRLSPDVAVAKAKEIYTAGTETSPYGLLILALSLAPDGVQVIRGVSDVTRLPASIRRQIIALSSSFLPRPTATPRYSREQLLDWMRKAPDYGQGFGGPSANEDFITSAYAVLRAEDSSAVREARRRSLNDPTMNSMAQFYSYTQILHAMESKSGLFNAQIEAAAEDKPARPPARKTRKKKAAEKDSSI